MRYHTINDGSIIPVYRTANCSSDYQIGNLYNGEVFTFIAANPTYTGIHEIRFLHSTDGYGKAFIKSDSWLYGNLAYYGQYVYATGLGYCYRFKLRCALNLVYNNGDSYITLPKDSYIYTNSATAGSSNPQNMSIIGYLIPGSTIKAFDGFITLNYLKGSMLSSNFCLIPE